MVWLEFFFNPLEVPILKQHIIFRDKNYCYERMTIQSIKGTPEALTVHKRYQNWFLIPESYNAHPCLLLYGSLPWDKNGTFANKQSHGANVDVKRTQQFQRVKLYFFAVHVSGEFRTMWPFVWQSQERLTSLLNFALLA